MVTYLKILARVASPVLVFGLAACAHQKFESEPKGPNTAEIVVSFDISSSRSVVFGGVFEDGRQCQNLRMTSVDGRTTPKYEMRVKPETLSMVFLSAGEFSGMIFGPGGWTGKRCGGTYSFDPSAGSQYEVRFNDEPNRCGVSLTEISSGKRLDISEKLVRRDAIEKAPGTSRCADTYVPR